MPWIKELIDPKMRNWEEFYRNRWQHDRVVRSTHGVNCTGGCSWNVYVKDGIVMWEMQALDYPSLEPGLPPYEPRGCQRGISASWYVYSPIRVKYPYIRGALLDLWHEAKKKKKDPIAAWEYIVSDGNKRSRYQQVRGKGGFRRTHWDEVLELIAASCLYTAKKWGPDRIFGFSPIPAMSYLSYAGGSRFLQLMGGVALSFYDWYSDLPNSFPEVWGEQTDVCESADWYNSSYIISMGANLNMTRTPDVHFVSEARSEGAKFVVIAPDFSQSAKYSDWWIPVKAGEDTALWMAVNHVILKEFYADRQVPYFTDYIKRLTDTPFLVKITQDNEGNKADQCLRADTVTRYKDVENGSWKLLVFDQASGEPRMPKGTLGFRWGGEKGKWNLKMEDGLDDKPIDPTLSFLDSHDEIIEITLHAFVEGQNFKRGVPVKYLNTTEGRVAVTTVFDLLMAQFGVSRGLTGDYPTDYNDDSPYTPAWQEKLTGIGRETVIRLAREFANNAEVTKGRSMIIVGAGINHYYHSNLIYRAPTTALLLTGCCGVNGGGINHYVGQEKVTMIAPWVNVAMGLDWIKPPRLQATPIWHYIHSDQWRYEGDFKEFANISPNAKFADGHFIDLVSRAVRLGWMPFFPQFNRNPTEIIRQSMDAGSKTNEDIIKWTTEQLKQKALKFAVEDPDASENWPRVWFIWRANAIMSSAKGHEYFLRHYLGTHDSSVAEERAKDVVQEVTWQETAPRGKMDLVIDLNFRMDTSALYSDIVLPAAMWYEKNDLNTTDLHSFIHNLGAAVPPSWESKSDWDIFKALAKKVSELAQDHFPEPFKDLVTLPLQHDSPDELAQPEILDWAKGECEPIPGKTMPHLRVVERDYVNLYNRFISFGSRVREEGLGSHGVKVPIKEFYDEILEHPVQNSADPWKYRCVEWQGKKYPSLEDAIDAQNLILLLAPESNGEIAYQAFKGEEPKTGIQLADLAEKSRHVRMTIADVNQQPKRILTSPCWSGIVNEGRAYAAYTLNVEKLLPWRTLTGRQHLYQDHPYYIDFGENLPTNKAVIDNDLRSDTSNCKQENTIKLHYLTPHGKWHIHSTYADNLKMLTLNRGIEPCWLNDKDAEDIGIKDNDWVEVYNDNGVVATRAVVSSRVQRGTCMIYHSPERTYMPKSKIRGLRRGGGHNSLTRAYLNPILLAGGYAQFTYGFNYWGPIGANRETYVLVRPMSGKVEW
ncbi:MAG: nitrate reductase subunit alpha [Candidatus Heimdallarchaeota archaeon]